MSVPTVEDFTVTEKPEEDLDGFSAWKNFGGRSLDEAYATFCLCPAARQEDFMWMGDRAFVFYFPVIDRYLREEERKCEFDGETYILAHCIGMHLPLGAPEVRAVESRLLRLCDFVLDGVQGLQERGGRSRSVHEVTSAWRDLRTMICSSPRRTKPV